MLLLDMDDSVVVILLEITLIAVSLLLFRAARFVVDRGLERR